MAETMSTLRKQQFALARHVRDPGMNPPPPGIEDRRLAIYRELFYNSIEGLLAGNFPVIRKILDDVIWNALVRGFYADYRCRTPLFTEVAQEFIDYLQQRAQSGVRDPPWLAELAHYEWVELALQIADDALPECDREGDSGSNPHVLLDRVPVLSPLAWALAYRWPVHRLAPHHLPDTPPRTPTLLLVRRDPAGDVHFSEISPLVHRLLELLAQSSAPTGRNALLTLAGEAGAPDASTFMLQGTAMLQRLHDEGTILGTRVL